MLSYFVSRYWIVSKFYLGMSKVCLFKLLFVFFFNYIFKFGNMNDLKLGCSWIYNFGFVFNCFVVIVRLLFIVVWSIFWYVVILVGVVFVLMMDCIIFFVFKIVVGLRVKIYCVCWYFCLLVLLIWLLLVLNLLMWCLRILLEMGIRFVRWCVCVFENGLM